MRRIVVRPRRLGTPIVLCVAVATFAALAVNSQGFPVQHVSLNDGGIWVTNNAIGAIGRFDKPIAQLDGQVDATSAVPKLDVDQNGGLVTAWDQGAGRLYAVDVYTPDFAGGGSVVSVAVSGDIALGGSTLAVLGTDHTLRTTTLGTAGASLAAVASGAAPRAAHLPQDAAVAVAGDNTVYVAGGGQLRRFPADDAGSPDVSSLPLPATGTLQVATVGNVPVVADATTKTLYLPASGRTVALPGTDTSADLALQQSSTASAIAVVATTQALYAVNLTSGRLTTLSSGHSGIVAQPVQVAGCIHAVWNTGATGTYVRSCGGQAPTASYQQTFQLTSTDPSLVFRVNRGEVVLNDTADGGVFLVDTTVVNADPKWQQLVQPNHKPNNNQNETTELTQAPLIARPDTQGARPGRTTVVHVLDNDSGPSGRPLAVTAVTQPDQPDVTVTIAPDAQTVLATVGAEGLSGDAHFQYTIDDGRGRTAQAQVTLVPRDNEQNSAPALRHDYTPPSLTVASGSSLTIPVIGDWRDFDGDPLYADSDDVSATAGSVGVTSGGALTYTAPQATASLTATIRYGVSDGIVARPTQATLTVHVLAAASTEPVPPVAEPDVAQAIVGMPVTIQPLSNDLPGADPTNPQAHLTLAAPVGAVPGAVLSTDLGTGTVTFTAERPGPFFLTYQAAYGAAPTSHGTIRIQASPATGKPKPPVAEPDVAVIHGQQPALVDVLANDYDPQGWVLGVVGASTADPTLQVNVVNQRWLRITSDDPQPGTTSTVSYTVSDGRGSATGTVTVSAVPAAAGADQITTQDDSVVIRAGDSAAVAVLANDSSSTGLPLSLDQIAPTATPPITGLTASNQGQDVRVTVPASVPAEEETTVSYVATDSSGAAATGHLDVTIEPPPSKAHPNQAPSPQEVDTRETAGDVETIHIPTYGIDPDGDSTAVTAVTVPPTLGRIVSIGPNTITYQSYPTSSGTDVFTYQVTDPYGATGTAQVRVGVLPPGPPQPPVAVDDVVNAPPGAALSVDVLANDYVAAGDQATVVPLAQTNRQLPAGVHLTGSVVYLHVPARVTDAPLEITYGITDGSSAPSLAQVIVRAVAGAKLPPIANDDVASLPAPGASTVTVDVLANDVDPTGTPGDLRISRAPAGVTIHGASLTIPVKPLPREVPYQVTAPDELTATAVVDVPGSQTSVIRLKPGARIKVNRHGSVTVPVSSVLTDTAGRPLQITTIDQLAASPAGDVSVDAHQSTAFTVDALGAYTGPGAVTVQVYDGTSLQDPRGHTATVTIPVQVGPDVPLLRCPSAALPVIEGGSAATYDIGLLCHVWVDTTISTAPPRYTVTWADPVGGVSAKTTVNGAGLILSAGDGAHPGASGSLRITPAGSAAGGTLPIDVTAAPLPTGRAVTAQTAADRAVTVDLAQYVTSPLPQPRIQVLSVTHPAGASVSFSGSDVTVTPTAGTHGAVSLVASVTDVPGRADRLIHVAITVDVTGPPGAPGEPSASVSDHTIVVSFSPAADNGAPVDHYTVFTNGAPHTCLAAPCTVTGLANSTYDVYVTAHNSAGDGPPSGHIKATPDQVPDQVDGLKATPSDGQVALSWNPATVDGSAVTSYTAEISPAPAGQSATVTLGGSATSTTFAKLTNGTTYSFRVEAVNAQGPGPWSVSVTAVPFGIPPVMSAPGASGAAVPDPAATRAVTVSWAADDDNGSQITDYTVTEYKSTSSGGPFTLASTVGPEEPSSFGGGSGSYQQSFTVNNDGTWYEYTVTATNAAGASPESPKSSPPIQGAAPPDAPGNLTALDHPSGSDAGYNGAIHVDFTVPEPNSAQLSSVEYGINAATVSGTWNAPGSPGADVDESIGGLTNGTNYAVYVRGCNDAGLCGPWAGPSGQVTPYGPPNAPSVSAQQNGTSITFSWSGGGGEGRPVSSYYVCFDGGSCESTGAGSVSKAYGNSQTHAVEVYAVDSAGQHSSTASASAATVAASPSVAVSKGISETSQVGDCTQASICYAVNVSVSNFPAGATLKYACSDNGGQFWPASGTITGGTANGSGAASFQTQCIWGFWSNAGHTLTVTVNGTSGSISG